MAKKSDNAVKGAARAPHRSLFYAMGYTDEELERPIVGVCCAKNEIIPGHAELDRISEAVKAGIDAALEVEGVISISAGNYDGKLGDKNINLLDILK